jgi:cellobiose phosphorylase
VGRGGWTWYTGAAGWMYRIMVQNILGVRREGATLRIEPCIPRAWENFDMVLRFSGAVYQVRVENPQGVNGGVKSIELDGHQLSDGVVPIAEQSGTHQVRVVLGK